MSKEHALAKPKMDIALRGLAEGTSLAYVQNVTKFLNFTKDREIASLSTSDVRNYLEHLVADKELSPRTVNSTCAALRFFFAATLDIPLNYQQVPRFKTEKKLPAILSADEMALLIAEAKKTDVRTEAMILLAYGSGLRVAEVAKLRLFIHQSKGKKDRYTLFPQSTRQTLRRY